MGKSKKKKSAQKTQDADFCFECGGTASANETTGMMPSPARTKAELEAAAELAPLQYAAPKKRNGRSDGE